ncbi:MAG: TIGR01906 family membrane protein [Chloroflexi bacterium]|nr:TIGR01906 family membrane protein [Chloroflexota bacterium]
MKAFALALASWLVTIGVPLLLVLGSVRLVMSPQYLLFEYQRPDMTADMFGFGLEDRVRWGPIGIDYLLTDADISLLGDLRFPDGAALFTQRELGHMVDVKAVTRAAFALLTASLAVFPLCAWILARSGQPGQLRNALIRGAVFTLSAIVAILFGATVAWDTFFALFHRAFFADGTWIFYTSDTLIRLYPEKFWFDAALTIGILVIGGALLILVLSVWQWRRSLRVRQPETVV